MKTGEEKGTILLVAAGDELRHQLAELPGLYAWRLLQAANGDQLQVLLTRERVDVALIDLDSIGSLGSVALGNLRRSHPALPLVAVGQALPADMDHPQLIALSRPIEPGALYAALEQARAQLGYRTLVADEAQARRQLEDLLLLRPAADALKGSSRLDAYLDLLVDRIIAAVGVRHCSLMLSDEDGTLRIAAARGLDPEVISSTRVAPGEGIAGQVFATGQALLIPDLAADTGFDLGRGFNHYLTNSLLSVPLVCRGTVRGVLNVNDKCDGTCFNDTDLHLLGGVAHQAMLALENLSLVQDLRRSQEELEHSNARLQSLLKSRSRLVCNLSHELKTPLTSVLGYVDLVLNHFEQLDSTELRTYLERVHEEGLQMKGLINDMLTLFSLESGRGRWAWQEVDLSGIVNRELEPRLDDVRRLGLVLETRLPAGIPAIPGDRERLAYLVAALLDNAIKFNRPGGLLQVVLEPLEDGVELRIRNHGARIPAEAAETIFEQYTQLGDVETGKPPGVGIGLAICRVIAERHGGTIRLEPQEGEGACVVCRLPVDNKGEKDD